MAKSTVTFAQQLARLKEIVEELERTDTDLERGVALYKEACACAAGCRKKLADARLVIERESGALADAEEFLETGTLPAEESIATAPARPQATPRPQARRQESNASFADDDVPF